MLRTIGNIIAFQHYETDEQANTYSIIILLFHVERKEKTKLEEHGNGLKKNDLLQKLNRFNIDEVLISL